MGPAGATARSRRRATRALELVVSSDEIPPDVRVHLKLDTGMGRWGLSELQAPPFEVVGLMSHLATADTDAAYTEWQIDRFRSATAALHAPDAPHREQRGRASLSVVPLRRRALRHRALRALAVRHRSGGRRARARAVVDVASRAVPPAPRRREHRLRPPLHRRARHVDRHRSRRLRRRLPPRSDRDAGARRGRAAAGRRDDLDGRVRGRARPRAADRHAGRADRPRHARGGSRARRRHDHATSSSAASRAIPTRARRVVVDG